MSVILDFISRQTQRTDAGRRPPEQPTTSTGLDRTCCRLVPVSSFFCFLNCWLDWRAKSKYYLKGSVIKICNVKLQYVVAKHSCFLDFEFVQNPSCKLVPTKNSEENLAIVAA